MAHGVILAGFVLLREKKKVTWGQKNIPGTELMVVLI